MADNELADVRVDMAACRVDKERRLSGLETWKKEQNCELKRIRVKGTATLIAIILLLAGVVVNLAVDRVPSVPVIEEVVQRTIEMELVPIVEEVIRQVVGSTIPIAP